MSERQSIEIVVLTENQDDVELVNGTLRDAGHAAHCSWIDSPPAFEKRLQECAVEFVILHDERYSDSIRQAARQKDRYHPEVPLLVVRDSVDERSILQAMNDGACDLVSIENKARLQRVVDRDLRAYRAERALNSTLLSAKEYRRQLNDYMEKSASAIAYVEEGIIVEANQAWVNLFRAKNKEDLVGMPIMDYFRSENQAAIKGALIATTQRKWNPDEKLRARTKAGEDDQAVLELDFRPADLDDGPTVQVTIAPPMAVIEEPTELVHRALKRDPTTLFYHRAEFLDRLTKRLKRKPDSGLQVIAYIRPDKFAAVRDEVGILDTEEILAQFAEEVRCRMHPRDLAGRFEGTALLLLLERGSERDAEAWGRQLVQHIEKHRFSVSGKDVELHCTVGVVGVSSVYSNLQELIAAAAKAHAEGKSQGGNCVVLLEANDKSTRLRKHDEIWVNHIKSALRDNRFRLAQLPIAGLRGDGFRMFDMLIRMIDTQGAAVLPSEFLPVAARNKLIRTIDRWMISASIEFAARQDAEMVFVKLSMQSMLDGALVDWMAGEFKKMSVEPARFCVQIPEKEAAKHIKETRTMVEALRKIGVKFALEHYGVDKNRFQILDILNPNFIKIDGELMHSLTTDTALQDSVRALAEAAEKRKIQTIAERVENANEMAVLFQLGISFMQGHYVHEPEVVLEEATNVADMSLEASGAA